MRRVLIYSPWEDTGGANIALKRAIDHCAPDWEARSVRRADNWIHYPEDITWPPGEPGERVMELFRQADVVHIMERPLDAKQFPGWERKPLVVQHLGAWYRDSPLTVSAECQEIGAIEAAGSHELLHFAPQAYLLVGAVDLDAMWRLRQRVYQPSERIRIVHAPTSQSIKSTPAFLAACERLATRYPIDVDLIQSRPNDECLERKARADILYDQVHLGYGLNAVEAWGMGMPVVAGLADPNACAMFHAAHGPFPWFEATEATIEDALEQLIVDPALRAEYGAIGRRFAQRVHSEKVVVAQTLAIYERAIAAKAIPADAGYEAVVPA